MRKIKVFIKSNIFCAVVPIFIWIVNNGYALWRKSLYGHVDKNVAVILLVVTFVIQLSSVVVPTFLFHNKYTLDIKAYLFIAIPFLYMLFALYQEPFIYLLVITQNMKIFFSEISAMPSCLASFFITLQFSVIMLITIVCINVKKSKENTK